MSRRWRRVMPPTVITELRLGPEQREIHQVLDVKGATSALPEDAEPERPALPPRPALTYGALSREV